MNSVKFAVVGCGNIGSRHLAVLEEMPNAKIVGICDIEIEKCKKYSALYGNLPYYLDYSEMINNIDADVVNICTPHGIHAPMAIEAAIDGKHILVEKPMALTVKDSQNMIKVAGENNVRLMVVRQNRYNIPIAMTKKALDENRLGEVFMVQCNVLWNRHQDYYNESNWRGIKILEGGALYTQVSHFIDLLIWWFGDIVEAKVNMDTLNHDIEIEDCGNALLTFESGVLGNLLWTTCVYNKNFEGSITIVGEKGIIKIGGKYLNQIDYWDILAYPLPEDVEFNDKPNAYGKYQGTSSNHDKVMQDVVSILLGERHNIVEGDEGIRTIKAIELIYKSANPDFYGDFQ